MINRLLLLLFFLCLSLVVNSQQKPLKPYQLHEQAEREFNAGHYQEALTLLDKCLQESAGYYEAYLLRASVKEQLNDLHGALTDVGIYLEQYPMHPEALMEAGVIRYKIGFYDQAKQDFKTLLQISSNETNALLFKKGMSVEDRKPVITTTGNNHNPYVYNYLGLIEYKSKNPRLAIAYFDSAIRNENKEPDFYVNRGLAKEMINDSTAITDYDIALHLQPNHALAKHHFKSYQQKNGITISKEERLSQTINNDSTLTFAYLERGQERFNQGDYKGALIDYDKALALDKDNIEILLARGLAKEKLNDFKGAFSDYTKAIDLKEDYAKAWLNRGNVLLKMERFEDAIEDYNVALVYYHDYAFAYYNRAMAKYRLKKLEESCVDLKHAETYGFKVDEKVKSKICIQSN